MQIIRKNQTLIISIIIFLLLTIPFITSIPYLDGNIDFVKSHDFFVGGFNRLFNNWLSVHPPVKEVIVSIFFFLGSANPISYNLIGILFGLIGILIIYKLVKYITNYSVANIAALLFCTSPLLLSAGLFSLTDYLLEVFILASLYFYLKRKMFLYFVFVSLAILTKETGLVLVISIFASEFILGIYNVVSNNLSIKKWIRNILIILTPLVSAAIWFIFLQQNGKTLWSDWNYSKTAGKGTIYTIANNIITFNIFNKYAYQNWLQLFFLNFNWVFWIIAFLGIIKNKIILFKNKALLSIFLFCLIYFISVLSFQTYTIPRYALPLEPFLYISVAYGFYKISSKSKLFKYIVGIIMIGVTFLRLFTSVDPISTHIWGKTKVLGQSVYTLNQSPSLAGFDGITYNLQYNMITKKRTEIILEKNKKINDCSWIFPDPNNDFKTIKILNLKNVNCYLQEVNQ